MSIFRIGKNETESVSVVAHPSRHFTSGSSGVTGNVHVFPRRSDIEKEVAPISSFVESKKNDADINEALEATRESVIRSTFASTSAFASVDEYLQKVNKQQASVRKKKVLDITRFIPSYQFTKDTLKKLYVKDVLNERYRMEHPSANWAYTNYNTLNFFTADTVPNDSALLYPNPEFPDGPDDTYVGPYTLTGSFSFDFYINPRYTGVTFDAGTIFHLWGSYALSLVAGSARDSTGRVTGYRLLLQVLDDANVPPTSAAPGPLTFLSEDNALTLNAWHHVVVRWDAGVGGSFNVDGVDKGNIPLNVASISPNTGSLGGTTPDVLVVGNHYAGNNLGDNAMALFFSSDAARREGLIELVGSPQQDTYHPSNVSFDAPLRAELHDLSIKRYYMTNVDIAASSSVGPTSIDASRVAFYVPPFFVQDSPVRRWAGDAGGILQTPFFEVSGATDDPFNVAMSFGVAGHYINIENFLRDFAGDVFPRAHHMSASALTSTTDVQSADTFIYRQKGAVRRNLLVMPCDDGSFQPSYELLMSESVARTERGFSSTPNKYVDDWGNVDPSLINLDNLVSTASLLFGSAMIQGDGMSAADKYIDELIGFSPEDPRKGPGKGFSQWSDAVEAMVEANTYDPGVQVGAPLTIYQRTKDPSSNQVTFFNISNLYYGKQILPGSFTLTDAALSGSGGAISVTLKDDGHGNIYRADAVTPHATWSSVGNIYYSEGIVVIKSPHLFFFGKHAFDVSFKGDHSIHVMTLNALAPAGTLNNSTNPTFIPGLAASLEDDDFDKKHVQISAINFHDENLNVVVKATLAQPILKRTNSTIKFRVKIDF